MRSAKAGEKVAWFDYYTSAETVDADGTIRVDLTDTGKRIGIAENGDFVTEATDDDTDTDDTDDDGMDTLDDRGIPRWWTLVETL